MTLPALPTLTGTHVRLEPLSHERIEELQKASDDGQLHQLWYTPVPSPDNMAKEIDRRLDLYAAGTMMPFVVVDIASNTAVGMTTLMNMRLEHRKVEIGHTWLATSTHGTAINPEAKLLLLTYAFDNLECNAVELRTHELNAQSRAAISKLGAHFDGLLRNDMIMPNGTIRNTAVYSITAEDWSDIKESLSQRVLSFS